MRRKSDIYQKIEMLLKFDQKTRNDDIDLTLAIWRRWYGTYIKTSTVDGREYVALEDVPKLPREDHVKRIRARIQNVECRYLPTSLQVFIDRAKASKEWKQRLGYRSHMHPALYVDAIIKYYRYLPTYGTGDHITQLDR